MKLILKYRNKIVSLGLLPIIATLICLHFFQNTIVLGIGFAVCVGLLLYGIIRLKDLNFFLLLGSVGIGACFALRLFTGYEFVPLGSITPILELLLLIVAFIHITAPTFSSRKIKIIDFTLLICILHSADFPVTNIIHCRFSI